MPKFGGLDIDAIHKHMPEPLLLIRARAAAAASWRARQCNDLAEAYKCAREAEESLKEWRKDIGSIVEKMRAKAEYADKRLTILAAMKLRYRTDPDYRAKVLAASNARHARIRAKKSSLAPTDLA